MNGPTTKSNFSLVWLDKAIWSQNLHISTPILLKMRNYKYFLGAIYEMELFLGELSKWNKTFQLIPLSKFNKII